MQSSRIMFLLLSACSSDAFVELDAAMSDAFVEVDVVDARQPDVHVELDASTDSVVVDAADAYVATCALQPASTQFDPYLHRCELATHPECVSPCEVDGSVAKYGVTCHAFEIPPRAIRAASLEIADSGIVGDRFFCASKNFCVPSYNSNGCPDSQHPYAWSCPVDWSTRSAYLANGCWVGADCDCASSLKGGSERCCTTPP